ncbi:MAG: carbohydrate ABC transporter permease [Chloroflexi bacterium]|nr:carbohydrate ABC transporter permease [Chloroflexota bacterium]
MSVETHSRHIREGIWSRLFDILNGLILTLLGVVTLGPFLYIIFGSLTDTTYYRQVGVSLNPAHWTLQSYQVLLSAGSRIFQSLQVTLFVTVFGTALGMMVTASLAYVVSHRQLPGHDFLVFFVFFTMLFGGGMVPFYLIVQWLGMVDTVWSMMIPFIFDAWYMFIMVRFFDSLPQELGDSGRIDGCSEIGILFRIVLPLSKPVLATIGLFFAVYFWNQWFWATVFIRNADLLPLQQVLRGILSQMMPVLNPNAAKEQARMASEMPPLEVLRMATIIVTVLPITLVYPFLQKYFVKGVMIGAIKG